MVTMATRVGIRELRDNLTALLRRVRDGETLEVTRHGRTVAVISPAEQDWLGHLIAVGKVKPAKPLGRPIRTGRALGDKTASEILQEDRDGR